VSTPCIRAACKQATDHMSGYCSDVCLRLDHDHDSVPVLVLAPNKAGGFGHALHWQIRETAR
jgi:hypothetical protein